MSPQAALFIVSVASTVGRVTLSCASGPGFMSPFIAGETIFSSHALVGRRKVRGHLREKRRLSKLP